MKAHYPYIYRTAFVVAVGVLITIGLAVVDPILSQSPSQYIPFLPFAFAYGAFFYTIRYIPADSTNFSRIPVKRPFRTIFLFTFLLFLFTIATPEVSVLIRSGGWLPSDLFIVFIFFGALIGFHFSYIGRGATIGGVIGLGLGLIVGSFTIIWTILICALIGGLLFPTIYPTERFDNGLLAGAILGGTIGLFLFWEVEAVISLAVVGAATGTGSETTLEALLDRDEFLRMSFV